MFNVHLDSGFMNCFIV